MEENAPLLWFFKERIANDCCMRSNITDLLASFPSVTQYLSRKLLLRLYIQSDIHVDADS